MKGVNSKQWMKIKIKQKSKLQKLEAKWANIKIYQPMVTNLKFKLKLMKLNKLRKPKKLLRVTKWQRAKK